MCGRIATIFEWNDLKDEFHPDKVFSEFVSRYNLAPSQDIPVIIAGSVVFDMYKWGFLPKWAKDKSKAMINARSEDIEDKPFFKEAFQNFRCLVPVSGFYEWDSSKDPFYIQIPEKKIFALAGIASIYKTKEGSSVTTVAILTIGSNSSMKKIHHRMPAIIEKKNYWDWIDPKNQNLDNLKEMLKPFPHKLLFTKVSKLVNSPKNDSPDVLKREDMQSKL